MLDECIFMGSAEGNGKVTVHPDATPLTKEQMTLEVKSKRHPHSIMVLAVICMPELLNPYSCGERDGEVGRGEAAKFSEKNNGKVCLLRACAVDNYKKTVYQFGSDKNDKTRIPLHKKGDTKTVGITIDGEYYYDFFNDEGGVLDKIQEYFGENVDVVLQEDGAPGHGYNNLKNRSPTLIHDKLVDSALKRNVTIFKQPYNSPELNCLDLGIWHSLQSKVKNSNINYFNSKGDMYNENLLWLAVRKAWHELEAKTIFNCYMVREEILLLLIQNKGATIAKEPHAKIRKRFGTY